VHLRQCLWDIRLVEEMRGGVVARDHDIEQIFDLAQIAEVSDHPCEHTGLRHLALGVANIDAVVAGVRARGCEFVGEVESYRDICRLCYLRGAEGIIVELAERIG
jgi:hypothetical protein